VREMPPEMAPASESTSALRICDGSSPEPMGCGGGGGGEARKGETGHGGEKGKRENGGWFGFWKKRRFGSWDGGRRVDASWWPVGAAGAGRSALGSPSAEAQRDRFDRQCIVHPKF
jgi:hypothetical protein